MSADQDGAPGEIEPAAQTSGSSAQQTPGDLLRSAREQRGLTVQQIADELHLDVKLVRSIEANNFLVLGAPVYAKGHLRKYASVLGMPADLVIASYEQLSDDVPVQPTVVPVSTSQPMPRRVSLRIPVFVIIGLALAGLLLWLAGWLLERPGSAQPVAPTGGQIEIPLDSDHAATDAATAAQTTASTPEMAPAQPLASPAQVEAPPAAAAVPAAGASQAAPGGGNEIALRLRFAEASWVEISDATQRRLMYDIGQPGQTLTVAGVAPLQVTLGVASAVTVDINNQQVPIPRRAGRDATRFTVGADGSVR